MLKKIKQKKGETLVETLAALLIATLSVMMLTSAITASARINGKNREADEKFVKELQIAESYGSKISETPADATFSFPGSTELNSTAKVFLYGKKAENDESEGRMITYRTVPEDAS